MKNIRERVKFFSWASHLKFHPFCETHEVQEMLQIEIKCWIGLDMLYESMDEEYVELLEKVLNWDDSEEPEYFELCEEPWIDKVLNLEDYIKNGLEDQKQTERDEVSVIKICAVFIGSIHLKTRTLGFFATLCSYFAPRPKFLLTPTNW